MGVLVRRHINILIIIITFSTRLVLALILQHHPYFFVHFKPKKFVLLAISSCKHAHLGGFGACSLKKVLWDRF